MGPTLRQRANLQYVRARRIWLSRYWAARYRVAGWRRRVAERLGSDRYSRPSHHGLDLILEAHLPAGTGTFVEAGAYDGYFASNTYYLERFRGWTGVLVEPLPNQYRRCVKERPGSTVFNCALVPDSQQTTVTLRCESMMSALNTIPMREVSREVAITWGLDDLPEITVPARTLTSVLDEAGVQHVDLLSLDVEGYEGEVLQGLDFQRFAPRWLLVETGQDPERQARIEAALPSDYELVGVVSPMDLLYVRR